MSSSDENGKEYEDNDEDSLCKFGTQLPQFEADEIPSKKPLQVEDMVVKDENGRRRFHGAFTGGFSAGYWNTVGSKDGFTPTEFKSSRNEKATTKALKPTDFMDEEDFGEFGIAPQKIQTKEDFGAANSSNSGKRRREAPSDGPIPGEPVLKNLLKPVHDKAAVRILKKMGWRDGQGIGSRMTYSEKKKTVKRNKHEMYILSKYGDNGNDSEDDEFSDEEITFVPDDFDPFIANIKNNTFGLDYSGLKPFTSLRDQHVNLFQPFQVYDKKSNKKFSISGQAFGVGALENDDDDIYAMDDLSNYDRTLGTEAATRSTEKAYNPLDSAMIEGFSRATINDCSVRVYPVDIPRDYEPRNWLERKSRFAPIDKDLKKVLQSKTRHKTLGLGRHDLKPAERGALLNEMPETVQKSSQSNNDDDKKARLEESSKKMLELLNSKQFVSEHSKQNETFKPFSANPDKQERYEKFVALKNSDEAIIEKFFNDIQPLSMSLFDREMEKKEFIQAKRMYQPLDSLIGNRFIKEVDIKQNEPDIQKKIKDGKEVIVIQRTKVMWKPNKVLCKLFNIPEPFGGMMFDEEEEMKKKKKQSSSLFDYIGVPLNTKSNFVTPQVIPRKLTEDHRKKNEEEDRRKNFLEAVEKEKSFMNRRATAKDFFDDVAEPMSLTKENESDVTKKEVKKLLPEPPKTELEIKVAESIHKKPEEKKDLFKAIFCDSDDDEEVIQENSMESTEAIKSNVDATLSEKQKSTFIESFMNTKSASELNVLRNASPPRGIFKSIFELGTSTSKAIEKDVKIDVDEEKTYGPELPKNLSNTNNFIENNKKFNDDSSSSSDSSLDEKLLKKLKKVKSSSKERWVEKDKVKKSKKHHKKKKSHKKSHKKHKSRK